MTPVHIISGFLGTGKTTAIQRYLTRHAATQRVAVIVNEFGAVDLDAATLASEAPGCAIVDVPGGCICCSAGAELYRALHRVLDEVRPDRIIIEPTGLAKASDVVDVIRLSDLAARLELRPIVTLIDPRRQFRAPLSRMPLAAEQAEAADILVANFADLCRDDHIEQFYSWAGGFFPSKLAVLTTSHGVLADELFEPSTTARTSINQSTQAAPGGATLKPRVQSRGWTWSADVVFDAAQVAALFRALASGELGPVLRAKGVFHTTAGWIRHDVAGTVEAHDRAGTANVVSATSSSHRRDSRAEVLLAQPLIDAGSSTERLQAIERLLEAAQHQTVSA